MKHQNQPLNNINWLHRDNLVPNNYNPNKVAPPELELLKISIIEDGWTQPIVINPDFTIVDGFHRWTVSGHKEIYNLTDGYVPTVMITPKDFVIKRGYDELIQNKKVLVVEDILTTGGSVRKVVETARKIPCEIVGVSALCNRGNVTPEMLGEVPVLKSIYTLNLESWDPKDCPLCLKNIPINTSLGKGTKR